MAVNMTEHRAMNALPKPLLVKIPLDYADFLGIDPTHLVHVNAGRRQLGMLLCIKLMEVAHDDPRLTGLSILHLRPELKAVKPFLFSSRKKISKKG